MKFNSSFRKNSFPDKLIFLMIMVPAFFSSNAFTQNTQGMGNPEYAQTVLFEDFESDTLNRKVWNVVSGVIKGDLFIFADTLATVNQNNNRLDLTMIRHPGYSTTIWSPNGMRKVAADFISGEVMTEEDFTYGIFECNATLAYEKGSFPACWLYSDVMCDTTERPEIDIVELKANHRNPTLDIHIWFYPANCQPQTSHEFETHKFSWGGTHTFKCVWAPDRIEFWVDSVKLKEVENTGQYWYPQLRQHVILSQQVIRFGRTFQCVKKIITPQTSGFNWVKVREFFPAPKITCPDNIISPETVILEVDSKAKNITWKLTPPDVFAAKVTGTGTEAEIIPSNYFHNTAKIIFSFEMPTGETFSTEKEFALNGLR